MWVRFPAMSDPPATTPFERFCDDFQPTWSSIFVGCNCANTLPRGWISSRDLDSFVQDRLRVSTDAEELTHISRTLGLKPDSDPIEDIRATLQPLSDFAGGDISRETRKWRVILLSEFLRTLPPDLLYALTELTAFWVEWDLPDDCPHIVRGRGKALTANEYYTSAMLKSILRAHREWIAKEIQLLAS